MSATLCSAIAQGAAPAVLAALLALPAAPASAQDAATPVLKPLPPIKIHRKSNPGDLPYKNFFQLQSFLQSLMPDGPRAVDLQLRLNFDGEKGPAYDEFEPKSWAVAIVGEATDHVVPVRRGGYFVLPELRYAMRENATIMFNTPTRKGRVAVEWTLRLGETQSLSYADVASAMEQVRSVQRKIPSRLGALGELRLVKYDGVRACFLSDSGRIEVDGLPAATIDEGKCRVLKLDQATASAGASTITFVGPLNVVTLNLAGI